MRVAACHTLALGRKDTEDEAFWAMTGLVQGSMAFKQRAVARGGGPFFPIQFPPGSIQSLHKGLQPLAPMASDGTGLRRMHTTLAQALRAAHTPTRSGTGALRALLLGLERAAANVQITHPEGWEHGQTAHGRMAGHHDAAGLLAWDPSQTALVLRERAGADKP